MDRGNQRDKYSNKERPNAKGRAGRPSRRNTRSPASRPLRSRGAQVRSIPRHSRRPARRDSRYPKRRDSRYPKDRAGRISVGQWRLRLVAAGLAVIGLLLGVRAFYLSVADGNLMALAAEPSTEKVASATLRGSILSADSRPLATTLSTSWVVATPYLVQDPPETARKLAGVVGPSTGLTAAEIQSSLSRGGPGKEPNGYSVVAKDLKPAVADEVRALSLAGISVTPDSLRRYPDGPLASQLIGYLGDYSEAFGGIESRYEEQLAKGQDVTLTVDGAVQQELETTLESTVEEYEAKSAVGVVMKVGGRDNGAVVALANVPGFDNNRFQGVSPELQRNRAITDPYEPGSTFKAFTLAAALEEGTLGKGDEFTVPDSIKVADREINDSLNHKTKTMTAAEILGESSNVGTVKIAQDLGGKRLSSYIERFGFGQPTGIDLSGESAGTVPTYREWSGSSIGNIPIGQGLTVSPLQLAAGYTMLANGGLKTTPYVAQEASPQGPGRRVLSADTSDTISGMLRSAVEEGTGSVAQIPGYSVAGKTGTTQKVDPETGAYGKKYITSFAGFAPAQDPEFVTLIAVDEPEKSMWGEVVAAPAFQKVMAFTLGYFNVPPDDPDRTAVAAGIPEKESE